MILDPLATVICFKSAEDLFSHVINVEIPKTADMSKFETAAEFLKLAAESKPVERFRNVLLPPSFIAAIILAIPSSSPSEWAATIKVGAGNMKAELADRDGFVSADFDAAVN